jgi:hypothetical protein
VSRTTGARSPQSGRCSQASPSITSRLAPTIRCIDLNRADGWSVEAWRWLATERARALARTPAFAATWRALVVRLGDLGERFVELRGDELDRFLGCDGRHGEPGY